MIVKVIPRTVSELAKTGLSSKFKNHKIPERFDVKWSKRNKYKFCECCNKMKPWTGKPKVKGYKCEECGG